MKILRSGTVLVIVLLFALLASCGGSGGSSDQFDDPTLNQNSTRIQGNVTDAELIFTGTITAVGTAPGFWSGIAWSTQAVTYTIDSVIKGTYTEATITLYHVLVEGSRQAGSDAGLSPTIFAVGNRLIVFAIQNPDEVSPGAGWEIPRYMDFDEEYGTIPWSEQNASVITAMLATPAAQTLSKTIAISPAGPTPDSVLKRLELTGDVADVDSFNALLEACKTQSTTLSNLVSQISNDAATTVTIAVGRNAARTFVDSFKGRVVDIADLESWHEGCNQKTDRCQLFGHILQEYWHAAVTGDGYAPSHASAIATENQIRTDLGKTTVLKGHWGVQNGGTWYMETTYGDHTELVELIGGSNVGPVTVYATPPAAPTNLAVADTTSCQLTVTWTDNASDEEGFDLYRKDGASTTWGPWWRDLGANVTSYVNAHVDDPTLVLGETYCYRVRAWKTVDADYVYSDYSNEACGVKH